MILYGHDRLGHVNYDLLWRLIYLNHISTFHIDFELKYETRVKAKMMRLLF